MLQQLRTPSKFDRNKSLQVFPDIRKVLPSSEPSKLLPRQEAVTFLSANLQAV